MRFIGGRTTNFHIVEKLVKMSVLEKRKQMMIFKCNKNGMSFLYCNRELSN